MRPARTGTAERRRRSWCNLPRPAAIHRTAVQSQSPITRKPISGIASASAPEIGCRGVGRAICASGLGFPAYSAAIAPPSAASTTFTVEGRQYRFRVAPGGRSVENTPWRRRGRCHRNDGHGASETSKPLWRGTNLASRTGSRRRIAPAEVSAAVRRRSLPDWCGHRSAGTSAP